MGRVYISPLNLKFANANYFKYQNKLTMKRLIFCLVAFTLSFTHTSSAQSKSVSNFSKLKTSGSVKVDLVHSSENKVDYKMISGSEDDLKIAVDGSTLVVKIKNKLLRMGKEAKAKVTVYYTDLDEISTSAGSSVYSEEVINSTRLDLNASSGSSLKVRMDANRSDVDASSGATINVKGTCANGSFDASSGSSIHASNLECDTVDADASSGATIKVHANKSISADASSGGSIKYSGNPSSKDIDASISGSIKKM